MQINAALPAPPAAPAAPGVPAPLAAPAQAAAPLRLEPLSSGEIAQLRAMRKELSDQLISASGRREELMNQLRVAPDGARAGLEQRIDVLDRRIVQLETDIGETGRRLAQGAAPARTTGTTVPSGGDVFDRMDPDDVAKIGTVFSLFVLAPLAIAFARLIWRRASVRPAPPAITGVTDQRIQRIEQAVDAIAIEVERITEGQRFLTNLLADGRQAPALVLGQREAIGVPRQGE